MKKNRFDLDAYLARIGFNGPADVSADTLARLHHAHFFALPFENFDILLGRRIDLDPQAVFDKLVRRKRGGYCFELNGLFLAALHALGFEARPLLARVHLTGTPSGRGHQLELITIGGRDFIADVGFGVNSPRRPMPLALGRPVHENGRTLRLVDGPPFGIMLQVLEKEEWKTLYSFETGPVFPGDIAYGNHYASTAPGSLFTTSRFAGRPLENGSVTLLDQDLKITTDGREQRLTLPDSPAYLDAVKSYFGIELDAPYTDLKPMPPREKEKGSIE